MGDQGKAMESLPIGDLESQLEELGALTEILGSEFIRKDPESESGLFGGTLHVNIWDSRYPFFVKYTGQLMRLKEEENTEIMEPPFETFVVRYLPPVELAFSFPVDYPSVSMPKFTLTSTWLHEKTMTQICKELDKLWDQNKGSDIIYHWYYYLRNEAYKLIRMREDSRFCIDFILCQQLANEGYPLQLLFNCVNWRFGDWEFSQQQCKKLNGAKRYKKDPATRSNWSKLRASAGMSEESAKENVRKAKGVDPRVVFELVDTKFDEYLQMYDEDQEEIAFHNSMNRCPVCFIEKRGTQCFQFSCGDVFCSDCVRRCFHLHIQSGQLELLKCMAFKCDRTVSYADIKRIVSPEDFERYESLQLQRNLEQEHSVATCPRETCQGVAFGEKDDTLTVCSVCTFNFCSVCKKSWHGVSYCYDLSPDEQQKIYDIYKSGSHEEKLELEMKYGKKLIEQVGSEIESRNWLKENSKACPNPSCHAPIEKIDGCNKVKCTKCKTLFCWLCAKVLDADDPYAHFNDPDSPCNQRLHEGNDAVYPEAHEDLRVIYLPPEEIEGAGIPYEDIEHLLRLEEDEEAEELPEWDVHIREDFLPLILHPMDPEEGIRVLVEQLNLRFQERGE